MNLLDFDLLEQGIYLARRGFFALSLPFDDSQVDRFVHAVDAVVRARLDVLPSRAERAEAEAV